MFLAYPSTGCWGENNRLINQKFIYGFVMTCSIRVIPHHPYCHFLKLKYALKHGLYLIHRLFRVIMRTEPSVVVDALFNHVQPFFGVFVHARSIDGMQTSQYTYAAENLIRGSRYFDRFNYCDQGQQIFFCAFPARGAKSAQKSLNLLVCICFFLLVCVRYLWLALQRTS